MSEAAPNYQAELEKSQIVTAATVFQPQCGVYFLVKNEEIVYVGQSTNIPQRIKDHTRSKDFDKVFYIQCDKSSLLEVEAKYIRKFRPALNKTLFYPSAPEEPFSFETFISKNPLLNKIPLLTIRYWATQMGIDMESEIPVEERLKILDFYGWYVSSSRFTSFDNCLPQDVARYVAYRNS